MNTLSQPPKPKSRKRKKLKKQNKAPSPAQRQQAFLLTIASISGFSGLIAHSILTGNIAYLGITVGLAGGIQGWLLGLLTILVSLVSTVMGLGAIFIPRQTLVAIRLMTLAGLGSLVVGLVLALVGFRVLLLAGTATTCFWFSAIATSALRRQRLREKLKKTRAFL
jgi:hypothetical protein